MESSTTGSGVRRDAPGQDAADAPTLAEALRRTAANHPDMVAVRTPDDEVSLTWSEVLERVDAIAGGLAKLGVGRGECVAIMLANRPEFHLVDLAAVTLGATPFSIYVTYPAPEVEFLLEDSECRVAIVEQAFLPVMLEAQANTPGLEHVIVVDGDAPEGTLSLAEVEGSDPDFDAAAARAAGQSRRHPDPDLHLGDHRPSQGRAADPPRDHVHRRRGARGDQVPDRLPGHLLAALGPHRRADGPPLHPGGVRRRGDLRAQPARGALLPAPGAAQLVLRRAADLGEAQGRPGGDAGRRSPRSSESRSRTRSTRPWSACGCASGASRCPTELEAQVAEADKNLFSDLREMLGLDQVIAVNVGAAPTPVEVLEFFHAIGIELAELWGMSETCGTGAVNRPGRGQDRHRRARPPRASSSSSPRTARSCAGGSFVMAGYRNAPEKTAEAIDADGWLHTGDIGDDRRGRLPEDRRPQEGADHQRRRQEHVAGQHRGGAEDRQPADRAGLLHRRRAPLQHGADRARLRLRAPVGRLSTASRANRWRIWPPSEAVVAAVQEGVDRANSQLARVEQIKKFTIVPGDWLPGGDELTPTIKLKRKPIAAKYAAEIEAMYAG